MKNLLYYLSIIILLSFNIYFFGIFESIQLAFIFLIYSLIFYILYFFTKKIQSFFFKKTITIKNYKFFLIEFIKKISFSIIIVGIIIGLFGYYQNYISPAKMAEITISNGEKTIIFQEMSHIGNKNFYDTIKKNLTKYKKEGFIYFYEGVKGGTKENQDNFNKAIGIKFTKDLYKNFGKLYGITFQTGDMFIGLVNNLDFNVDVSIDWIMKKYGTINKNRQTKEIIDINTKLLNTLAKLDDKKLQLLRFINKAILNALIKNEKAQSLIQEQFANKKLFDIILNARNEILASEIIKSKYKKIYITYGKLHFNGMFELLKKYDSNYKIIKIKKIKCIY